MVVFVPGAWRVASESSLAHMLITCNTFRHVPAHYEPVVKLLRDAGYEVATLRHPSVSVQRDPGNMLQKDARVVADNIRKFVSTTQPPGQDVVLVMHSYGGVSGSEAAAIVSEALQSEQDPDAGRIRRLVYLAAHVIEKGSSFIESGRSVPNLDINKVRST